MKAYTRFILLILGLGLVNGSAQSLDRIVIASGGVGFGPPGSGGAENLSFTIGESVIGSFANPSSIMTIGFQQGYPNGANLPVEWLGIQVGWEGKEAVIQWWVANEVDNHYFEVERSVDGEHFLPVGQVSSDPGGTGYVLSDSTAQIHAHQIQYYRVRQIDFDGSFSYSKRVALQPQTNGLFSGLLFPNPAQGRASYRLIGGTDEILSLQLFDAQGRKIWEVEERPETVRRDVSLPVSALPAGQYFLRVIQGDMSQHFHLVVR